jgi:hypothetical protein
MHKGHTVYYDGKWIYDDGKKAEVLSNVLPVIVNPRPIEADYEAQSYGIKIESVVWTIDMSNKIISNHNCVCGECEDCKAHAIELYHSSKIKTV